MEDCGSKKMRILYLQLSLKILVCRKMGVVCLSLPWKIVVCKKKKDKIISLIIFEGYDLRKDEGIAHLPLPLTIVIFKTRIIRQAKHHHLH